MQMTLLEDLLEVTAINARYKVIENLHNSLSTGLEIDPNYQKELVVLCIMLFRYFDFAILLARKGSIEQHESRYTTLLTQIREMSKESRGFRILITIDDNEESTRSEESQSDQTNEVEDGEWEQVDGVRRRNSESISGFRYQ